MLNLPKIFEEIALEKARREAEKARIKAQELKAFEAYETKCESLRPGLMDQASAKATAWLKANLIMPQELLRFEECENGLILYIRVDDAADEEKEWEVKFLFFFGGKSSDSLSVQWAEVNETRDLMRSYCSSSYW